MTMGELLAIHIEDQQKINESVLNALQVFKDTDAVVHNSTLEALERLTFLATSFEMEINALRKRIDDLEARSHRHHD